MKKYFKRAISILLVAVMVLCSAPIAGFIGLETDNSQKAAAYYHNEGTSNVKTYEEVDAKYDKFVYVGIDVIEVENNKLTDGYVQPGDWLEYRMTVLSDLYIGTIFPIVIYDKEFFDVRVVSSMEGVYHDSWTRDDYEPESPIRHDELINTDYPYVSAEETTCNFRISSSPMETFESRLTRIPDFPLDLDSLDCVQPRFGLNITNNNVSPWSMTADEWVFKWYVRVREYDLSEGMIGESKSVIDLWRFGTEVPSKSYDSTRPGDISTTTDPTVYFGQAYNMTAAREKGILENVILEDTSHTFVIGEHRPSEERYHIDYIVDDSYYDSQHYYVGDTIGLPEDPEKEGYVFAGWEWTNRHTGEVIAPLERMPDYDLELNAKWAKAPSEIEYYLAVGGELYETLTFDIGESITHPAPPEMEGFSFIGWADEDGNLFEEDVMGEDDIRLYAQYEINTYSVTYMVDDEVYEEYDIVYQAEVTIPADPVKEGYIFAGWDPAVVSTMPDYDLVYNATWIENDDVDNDTDDDDNNNTDDDVNNGTDDDTDNNDNTNKKYTATFLYHNGETYKVLSLSKGETIEFPDAPEKFGYVFTGWNPEVPSTMPAEDMVFEPQYEIDKEFVSIVAGGTIISGGAIAGNVVGMNVAAITGVSLVGGVFVLASVAGLVKNTHTATYIVDGEVYKTYKVVEGFKIPVPESPVKDGFVFGGWNPEVPEKMGDKDVTFEAVWSENNPVDVEIPETGSASIGLAAFAAISSAVAVAYIIVARKKED